MADQPDDGVDGDGDDGSREAPERSPSRPGDAASDEASDGSDSDGSGPNDRGSNDDSGTTNDPEGVDSDTDDSEGVDSDTDDPNAGGEGGSATSDDPSAGTTWADSPMEQPSKDAARGRSDGATAADETGEDRPESDRDGEVTDDFESDSDDDSPAPDDNSPAPDDDSTDSDASADPGSTPRAETDGEGYVGDHPDRNRQEPAYPDPDDESSYPDPDDEPPYPDPDDDVGGISQPPDDEEMPLADHIEEMVLRFAVAVLVGAAVTAVGLLWASDAIWVIWNDIFSHLETLPPPHVYNPIELWLARIKVASLAGILAALPVFVYETYLFMRPGLYSNERRYYLASVPLSLVLGIVGMVYSYYLVLPVLFRYFTYYSEGSAEIAYGLGDTFNLVITLTGFLAIVFQIPLFIMLAIMMGVTTRQWLADKRLYFWGGFAVLAGTFTMDPTLMAAILVALTMIALFEGTLLLLKWVGRE